jgi:hypothetical protein
MCKRSVQTKRSPSEGPGKGKGEKREGAQIIFTFFRVA